MAVKESKKFENEQLRLEILDGILHAHYKKGLKFTLDVSKQFVEDRLNFLEGKKYPILVFDEGMVSMDKASRDFFASEEGVRGVTAAAFIENSFFSKMLIDFFLGTHDSAIKAKAFTDAEEAIRWLKSES